jgi:hypothetical protein
LVDFPPNFKQISASLLKFFADEKILCDRVTKELKKSYAALLRIRIPDLDFSVPDFGFGFFHRGSRILIFNTELQQIFKYFKTKNWL